MGQTGRPNISGIEALTPSRICYAGFRSQGKRPCLHRDSRGHLRHIESMNPLHVSIRGQDRTCGSESSQEWLFSVRQSESRSDASLNRTYPYTPYSHDDLIRVAFCPVPTFVIQHIFVALFNLIARNRYEQVNAFTRSDTLPCYWFSPVK